MKKFLVLLLGLFLIPGGVEAMAVSEEFNVGDSVSVGIRSDDERAAFNVLKPSAAGEQYVWLIYDGVVKGSPEVYDSMAESHTASADLKTSVIYETLVKGIADWRYDEARLLTLEDITSLGIEKNASGIYEIPAKYSFIAPKKIWAEELAGTTSSFYNYWMQTEDTIVTKSAEQATDVFMYYVKYNEDRANADGIWASLDSVDISLITPEEGKEAVDYKKAIRPVVKVDKKYIICNNNKPVAEVKTGLNDYILPFTAVVLIAGVTLVLTKRKNVFQRI